MKILLEFIIAFLIILVGVLLATLLVVYVNREIFVGTFFLLFGIILLPACYLVFIDRNTSFAPTNKNLLIFLISLFISGRNMVVAVFLIEEQYTISNLVFSSLLFFFSFEILFLSWFFNNMGYYFGRVSPQRQGRKKGKKKHRRNRGKIKKQRRKKR
jgi:hypothetical protein